MELGRLVLNGNRLIANRIEGAAIRLGLLRRPLFVVSGSGKLDQQLGFTQKNIVATQMSFL